MQSAAAQKLEPVDRSGALRAQLLTETPRWYNPYVHLAIPSLTGIGAIALALSQLKDVSLVALALVPAVTYAICNAIEWWAHKYLLHHRNPLAPVLYDQHTPKHHMVYTHEDMAIRDIREFRMVLIPAYGVFLIVIGQLPILFACSHYGHTNVGLLWVATATAYAVGYEWLHLSYHLDPESRIGRLGLIRWLRRQHTIHHDPRLMQSKNFNVTVPLFDWILGTQTNGSSK